VPTTPESEQNGIVAEFDNGNVLLVVDETERLAGMIIMADIDTDVTEACEDAWAELIRRHPGAEFGSEPGYVDGHEVFTATWLYGRRSQSPPPGLRRANVAMSPVIAIPPITSAGTPPRS
jgi:hypothetical protein